MSVRGKFFIINDCDKPHPRHVVQKLKNGKGAYIHPELTKWNDNNGYFTFDERATDVEDFGIEIDIEDGIATFDLVQPSDATYQDGIKREWQGDRHFELKIREGIISSYVCDNCEDIKKMPASEFREGMHCECGGHLSIEKRDNYKEYEVRCLKCKNQDSSDCINCKWSEEN